MSFSDSMQVTLRLPTRTLYEGEASELFAIAEDGAFGVLPNYIDFVTALVPSVMIVTTVNGKEVFFGIDEGIFVKTGDRVDIAIRRGVQGDNLDHLRDTVDTVFVQMDEDERVARSALSRLEAGIVRRFSDLRTRRT